MAIGDDEKLGYADLFDFSGPNPITKATKAIEALEVAYSKLASNLTAEAIRIGQSQNEIGQSLQKLEPLIRAVNLATETGRRNAAKVSAEIDKQKTSYDALKASQKGAEAMNKAVSDSLEGLRQQLKADRAELVKLGQAANPERLRELASSINETKVKSEQLEKAVRGTNSIFAAARGSYNALLNENRQLAVELKNLGGVFDKNVQRTKESIAREAELKEKIAANTEVLKRYDSQLNQHFRNVGNYANSIIEAVNALNQEKAALSNQLVALQRNTQATNLDAAAQQRLQNEIAETASRLNGVNGRLAEYGVLTPRGTSVTEQFASSFKQAKADLKDFALGMVGTVAIITALAAGISKVAQNNIEYSDTLADVAKTTGLSIAQTAELADKLKDIDTRTTEDALLKIAEIGGQLGIAKGDVEGFTKAIDVAAIALKNDFGGDVERIAVELGKINTVFKISDAVGIERALLDVGSAVNELGAAGAATAPFLTDFALRTGQAATNAGLGLDKILGFGAALEELGFSAEVAGTATNKLLTSLAGNAKDYFAIAKIADANLTLKQFKNLVNNDVNAALNLFLKGLRNGGAATTDFATLVKSLGLKSGGAVNVLTALAKNTELVADKQRIANEQLDNGNSLANEAAIKNDNLAASYEKTKNALTNFTTGTGAFSKFLQGALDYTTQLIKGNIDWAASFRAVATGQGLLLAVKPPTKELDDYGLKVALSSKAMQDAATKAEGLYAEYVKLTGIIGPNAAQQQRLREVVLGLRDTLGDSAVVLNKETGKFDLNTVSVEKNIAAKRSEAYTNGQRLAQKINALDIEAKKERALASAMQERADIAKRLLSGKIANPGSPEANATVSVERKASPGVSYLSKQDIANYDEYIKLTAAVAGVSRKAENAEHDREMTLNRLKILFPNLIDIQGLLLQAEKATTVATLEDADAKKEAAKAAKELAKELDALAKAQFELAKFRAENRATTFETQANNQSNGEEFRVEAAANAAAKRVEIAQLEQKEKIRLAVKEAADLKNGDAVLSVQRQLISEQYAARIKEIERDLTKEQKAIHNDLLGQLREIDRLRIDVEQQALTEVLDNENAGFAIRSAAQKQYAANQILLAKTIYDEEIIAANGAANKVKLAVDKMAKAVDDARKKVKPFDSKLANDELSVDYSKDQLALEESRAQKLITEKEYQSLRREMEDEYLKNHLTNLEVEKDGTKEAIDEALALRRKQTEDEIALEKEKLAKRLAIIEEGAQLIGAIGSGLFEIQQANLANELTAIQAQKDNDIAIAGDNAKAKSKIENDAARESAKIKRKQALAARAEALFNIALNTGVAVTKAVMESPLTFGLPWSAFALANGVVQAALVLAKPIPAFAKGTEYAPAGVALVGEAGAEILEYGGRQKLVTGPTLVDLQAGTRVFNNEKTIKIFEERGLSTTLAAGYSKSERSIADAQRTLSPGELARIVGRQTAAHFAELTDVIKQKESVGFSFDKNGFNTSIYNGFKQTIVMDARYKR